MKSMMFRWMLGFAGKRAMHAAARPRPDRAPLLDFGLGFRLMRDRRVPVATKALALLLGTAAVAMLFALEVPVEALVGGVLNVLGLGLDVFVDGLEFLIGPVVFAALFLTHLVPAELIAHGRGDDVLARGRGDIVEVVPAYPPVVRG